MQAPKIPLNEDQRLARLNEYRLLDTAPEAGFDDITQLAAFICGTPIALVTLVDRDRQWFKSAVGLDVPETSRDVSFCGHVVHEQKSLVVHDTHSDQRFADNPLVTGSLGLRFYAGHPLTDESGHTFGSLCVIDREPRELNSAQLDALAALSRQVIAQMKMRRETRAAKEYGEALQETQRLLKQYFTRDDVYMGIVEFNGTQIIQLYNNPLVEAWFEAVGVDGDTLTRESPLPEIGLWFEAYEKCASTRQTQQFETVQQFTGMLMRSTIHHVGESNEGLPRMAFTVEDVTKQRQSERLVEEQRQIVIQTTKLSALGEMAAGLAHEINNPLAIIGGRAQEMRLMVERANLNPIAMLNAVSSIEKTVLRISKIVRGLRSFARESSRDPLEAVKLGDVVAETLSFCTARFRAHGVDLTVKDGAPGGMISARPAEISQVLLNLLNNAFDAVKDLPGPRWVRIDLVPRDEGFEVSVLDAGCGVPVDIRSKIMQPFFTTKPVNRGTGLGLSISKGIVEAHQGRLDLDEASPSTRFVIWLPCHAGEIDARGT